MMIKVNLLLLCILLINPATTLSAVHLSETDQGQAMVIPFYTVANELNTLVAINNMQNTGKAIKINVREGKDSAAIYTFNLYLDPYDSWSIAMVNQAGFVRLIFVDDSCVLNLPNPFGLPDEINVDDSWKWETGLIEVIEMGNVNVTAGQLAGEPLAEQCDSIAAAWMGGGAWMTDPTTEITPVSGGVQVESTVIDVSNGFAVDIPTVVLDGFFPEDTIAHTAPGVNLPDLGSGTNHSLLKAGDTVYQTTWQTGYEAVSALLMKTTIENEYDISPFIGGVTEWVFSFPTLRFHANNSISQAPFIFEDSGEFRFPNNYHSFELFDRKGGEGFRFAGCGILCPPLPRGLSDSAINTLIILEPEVADGSFYSVLSGPKANHVEIFSPNFVPDFISGKLLLEFSDNFVAKINDRGRNSVTNAIEHHHGLPVIGFAFQMYQNSNAQPGLLATYASVKPHYGKRLITTP